MRIKLEFIDGTTEIYDAGKIEILTDSFAGYHTLERQINQALIRGGIFEVPAPRGCTLMKKIKISSYAIRKVILLEYKK